MHVPVRLQLGARMHDMLADGREHIREHIREHFDIREDPSLHKLAEDERELLIRMLDVDPRKRRLGGRAAPAGHSGEARRRSRWGSGEILDMFGRASS